MRAGGKKRRDKEQASARALRRHGFAARMDRGAQRVPHAPMATGMEPAVDGERGSADQQHMAAPPCLRGNAAQTIAT